MTLNDRVKTEETTWWIILRVRAMIAQLSVTQCGQFCDGSDQRPQCPASVSSR